MVYKKFLLILIYYFIFNYNIIFAMSEVLQFGVQLFTSAVGKAAEVKMRTEGYKEELINRGIRNFNEKNWFEWGAPRNIKTIIKNMNKECIYVYNLTRKQEISFLGNVNYFGGSLLMMIPKKTVDLTKIIMYLNSDKFKENFIFSGRFKIGHRQLSNSYIPSNILS